MDHEYRSRIGRLVSGPVSGGCRDRVDPTVPTTATLGPDEHVEGPITVDDNLPIRACFASARAVHGLVARDRDGQLR